MFSQNKGKRNVRANISKMVMVEILQDINRKKERLNPNRDTENRKKVIERIAEYRKKGIGQEEAVDFIMQDKEVLEQFSYLTKNGLDIRQCILNWSNKIYREQQSSLEKER